MGNLDRRLVGDTYRAAHEWGLIKLPGAIIFHTPEVAEAVEKAVSKEIEREQAVRRVVNEAIAIAARETIIDGVKKARIKAKENDKN